MLLLLQDSSLAGLMRCTRHSRASDALSTNVRIQSLKAVQLQLPGKALTTQTQNSSVLGSRGARAVKL